jgi:hypothetical protein
MPPLCPTKTVTQITVDGADYSELGTLWEDSGSAAPTMLKSSALEPGLLPRRCCVATWLAVGGMGGVAVGDRRKGSIGSTQMLCVRLGVAAGDTDAVSIAHRQCSAARCPLPVEAAVVHTDI